MSTNNSTSEFKLIDFPGIKLQLGLSIVIFIFYGFLVGYNYVSDKTNQEIFSHALDKQKLIGEMKIYNEVIRTSAKMYMATSTTSWQNRYNENLNKLEQAIQRSLELVPSDDQTRFAKKTEQANKKLSEQEAKAFTFVNSGNAPAADSVLNTLEYNRNKSIYEAGLRDLSEVLDRSIKNEQNSMSLKKTFINIVGASSFLIILVLAMSSVGRTAKYLKETFEEKNKKLQVSESKLRGIAEKQLEVNEQLLVVQKQMQEKNEQLEASEKETKFLLEEQEKINQKLGIAQRELQKNLVEQNRVNQKLVETQDALAQRAQELENSEKEMRILAEAQIEANEQLLITQKQLQTTLALQKGILESAAVAIISTDINGIITSVNNLGAKWLQYEETELVNKQNPTIFHDLTEIVERSQTLTKLYKENVGIGFEVFVYEAKKSIVKPIEYTYIRRDGTKFPISLTVSAIRDEYSNIIGYLSIAEDITERKKAEQQIIEKNEKMQKAIGELRDLQNQMIMAEQIKIASGEKIIAKDEREIELDFSYIENLKQKGLPVSEYEEARLKALYSYNVLDTLPEEEFDRITRLASYICGTEIALISLIDKDRQWFKSKVGLLVDETPRDMAFCQYVVMDGKVMEVENASVDERFKDNPLVLGDPNIRFYAGAPLQTEDGLSIGTLCVINSKPMSLTSFEKECLQDLSKLVMERLEALRQKALLLVVNNQVNDAFQKVQQAQDEANKALEKAKRSEEEMRLLAEAQMEANEKLMMAEINLKKTLELEQQQKNELDKLVGQLKDTQTQLVHTEKMASLGQLTAGIAHEINNPINFVYNGIDTLKISLDDLMEIVNKYNELDGANGDKDGIIEEAKQLKEHLDFQELTQDIEHLVSDIKKGAVRTMEIVKGLRVFSRLDEEERKPANIKDCLDSTLILLNNKIKGRVELKKYYDATMSDILCYPGQLNQVFMNIISNAIQAIPEERKDGVIEIYTENLQENVIIRIKDNGVGMSEQVKRRIFEPFFTTKAVGVGTGLGLSITFGIIEKHNGNIFVNSEEGRGTEFVIQLPKATV